MQNKAYVGNGAFLMGLEGILDPYNCVGANNLAHIRAITTEWAQSRFTPAISTAMIKEVRLAAFS